MPIRTPTSPSSASCLWRPHFCLVLWQCEGTPLRSCRLKDNRYKHLSPSGLKSLCCFLALSASTTALLDSRIPIYFISMAPSRTCTQPPRRCRQNPGLRPHNQSPDTGDSLTLSSSTLCSSPTGSTSPSTGSVEESSVTLQHELNLIWEVMVIALAFSSTESFFFRRSRIASSLCLMRWRKQERR